MACGQQYRLSPTEAAHVLFAHARLLSCVQSSVVGAAQMVASQVGWWGLQRIHEARIEHMQGGTGRYEERVLPDSKAGASARQREQREAEERGKREERERERRERQRTRQQHGLRHIWNTLLRPGASDSSAASSTTDLPGVPPGTPTSDDGNSNDYVVCAYFLPAEMSPHPVSYCNVMPTCDELKIPGTPLMLATWAMVGNSAT